MTSQEPLVRVVRGTPTAEELAVLVGVLLPRARAAAVPQPRAPRSYWRESALPGVRRRWR